MIDWLLSTAITSLALAILVAAFIWFARPNAAVRHALWLVVMLKLVIPTGLIVQVPLPIEGGQPVADMPTNLQLHAISEDIVEVEQFVVTTDDTILAPLEAPELPTVELLAAIPKHAEHSAPATGPSAKSELPWRTWLLIVWLAGGLAMLGRQLRETWRFHRFASSGQEAPADLIAEVAQVATRLRVRSPRVRVLSRLTSPLIWCPWRPSLLWPAGLDRRLTPDGRRAVLAHELAHLRRLDHWSRRLEMLASVLHWWNPVFWVARKRLRTDAELACDAWAADQASPRSYAEALLTVCSFENRRRPAAAVAASGEGRRAMQERLTMIMHSGGQCRLAFGAKLIVVLMGIAAIPAWTLGQSKPLVTPLQADPEAEKIEAQIKQLQEKLATVRAARAAEAKKKAEAAIAAAQEKLKDKLAVGQATANAKVVMSGQDGFKVIGPDGKERKDVRIIIVDKVETSPDTKPKPSKVEVKGTVVDAHGKTIEGHPLKIEVRRLEGSAPDSKGNKVEELMLEVKPGQNFLKATDIGGNKMMWFGTHSGASDVKTMTLTRATYKLPKEQASTLAALLGNVKGTVLEAKAEGESITITTTPELQATLGQLINLMTGKPGVSNYRYLPLRSAPATVPAVPSINLQPLSPSKPAANSKSTEKKDVIIELKADAKMEADAILKKLHDLLAPAKPAPGK